MSDSSSVTTIICSRLPPLASADFFARHGVSDYVIVQSFGATEAALNVGAAEAIVDITSTGATLTANQLRVPEDGVMLKSEANLAASLRADWSETARGAAKTLLARLAAYRSAGATRQVSVPFCAQWVMRLRVVSPAEVKAQEVWFDLARLDTSGSRCDEALRH